MLNEATAQVGIHFKGFAENEVVTNSGGLPVLFENLLLFGHRITLIT